MLKFPTAPPQGRGKFTTDCSKPIFLALCLFAFFEKLPAQCTLVCNASVNISLDQSGAATIAPETMAMNPYNPASCSPTGPQYFEVTVMFQNGQTIPGSPVVTCSNLGQNLTVKVKHLPTGNNCWGQIQVQDYLPPTLSCPDKTVSCNIPNYLPTNPAVGFPTTSDNCDSDVSLSFSDNYTDVPCGQTVNGQQLAGYVTRSWTAVDNFANTKTCVQHIWLSRRTVNDISFPGNVNIYDCANPNTAPSATGLPMVDGLPLDGFCEMSFTFSDQNLPMCGLARKILRNWTALDWCTNQIRTHTQIIAINDTLPPTLVCPPNMTVSTNVNDCLATLNLPAAQVSDACSVPVSVKISSNFETINANGGSFQNVATGSHSIVYTATDGCGNSKTCAVLVEVEDQIPPVAICDGSLIVALNNFGTGIVNAKSFDNGSYDNCCAAAQIQFAARRMQDSVFLPKITFNCSHVGIPQTVVLQVKDCDGNENECMTNVEVQDKTKPVIVCPASITVNCNAFSVSNLDSYGMATATDNCDQPTVEETTPNLNNLTNCGTGFAVRNFKATDSQNRTSTCTQRVTVVNPTAWDGTQNITWPTNFTANTCALDPISLSPDSLPPGSNFPTMNGVLGCTQLAYSFEDQLFMVAPPACYKIFRRWKVVDWCQYDLNNPNGSGQWTHVQTITVMDTKPPVFVNVPASITVGTDLNCLANFSLPNIKTSDCSDQVLLTSSSPLGSGFGPFQNVSPGEYLFTLRATDGCGNVAIQYLTVKILDNKPPNIICHSGLSVSLMPSGMVEIWAKDFDAGTSDNCFPKDSIHFAFSQNPADTGKVFNCQNVGTNVIEIWATDPLGNSAFCSTFINIQDNSGACAPTTATVTGAIQTPQNQQVANVDLVISGINGLPPIVTNTSGSFAYPGLPVNVPFTLTPRKNDNPLNGVTTLDLLKISKHILGVEPLDSPYKLLAADANRSNTVTTFDIVQIRKLILGIFDTLPGNTSWRFVDADFQFADPNNPLAQPFPESKFFNLLPPGGGLANFVAVKIGDLNGSVSPNFGDSGEDRGGDFDEANALIFNVLDKEIAIGESIEIPFFMENFDGAEGYQFALKFDASALAFGHLGGLFLENLSAENFNFRKAESGVLIGNWEAAVFGGFAKSPHAAAAFSLNFKAQKAGRLSDFFQFENQNSGEGNLPKTEGYRSGKAVSLKFKFENSDLEIIENQEFALKNSPNPFSDETKISFFLPGNSDARLSIFDENGRLVFSRNFENLVGEQVVFLRGDDFPGKGVFQCRLETVEGIFTSKIVKI